MEEQKSVQQSKNDDKTRRSSAPAEQQQYQRRVFESPLDKLKSALKKQQSKPSPSTAEKSPERSYPETSSPRIQAESEGSPELEEIERRLKEIPESELKPASSPQLIRETAHGIEKFSPIQTTSPYVAAQKSGDIFARSPERVSQEEAKIVEEHIASPRELKEAQLEIKQPEVKSLELQQEFKEPTKELQESQLELKETPQEIKEPQKESQESQLESEETSQEFQESQKESQEPQLESEEAKKEPITDEPSSTDGSGESDLEPHEFEPPASIPHDLPTMEQERESFVEAEAQWVKEHHMEPDEDLSPGLPHPPNTQVINPSEEIASETSRQHRGSPTDRDEDLSIPK